MARLTHAYPAEPKPDSKLNTIPIAIDLAATPSPAPAPLRRRLQAAAAEYTLDSAQPHDAHEAQHAVQWPRFVLD